MSLMKKMLYFAKLCDRTKQRGLSTNNTNNTTQSTCFVIWFCKEPTFACYIPISAGCIVFALVYSWALKNWAATLGPKTWCVGLVFQLYTPLFRASPAQKTSSRQVTSNLSNPFASTPTLAVQLFAGTLLSANLLGSRCSKKLLNFTLL